MDKKSTVAIVILFTMIVIGSIVYTIFSVVKTDGLKVDRRANVIKEEMVSMEQSIEGGNLTKDDLDKDNDTTNSTVNTNQNPNNVNSDDKSNQNTSSDNTGSSTDGQKPSVDNPSGGDKPSGDNPNNGGTTEEEKPRVIKNSIFRVDPSSYGYYQDSIKLEQPVVGNDLGNDIYVYVDEEKIESEDIIIRFYIEAPESYPEDQISYFGTIGENNLSIGKYKRTINGIPYVVFDYGYPKGATVDVNIGWIDSGVRTYTIHFM